MCWAQVGIEKGEFQLNIVYWLLNFAEFMSTKQIIKFDDTCNYDFENDSRCT